MRRVFLIFMIFVTCLVARDYERRFYNQDINSYDRKYYNNTINSINQNSLVIIYQDNECSPIDACGIPFGHNNHVVNIDYDQMINIAMRMCDIGKMSSCVELGNIYLNSTLNFYDYNKAYSYYNIACSNGNMYGCYELGNFYLNDYGYGTDSIKAKLYFKRACKMGYNDACRKIVAY